MTPQLFYDSIVKPTLVWAQPLIDIPPSDEAAVLLMAIAGQESEWTARRQIGCYHSGTYQEIGARGRWQCERLGAVAEVMADTPKQLAIACAALGIPVNNYDLYEAIAWNDPLACVIARLTLWTDPAPLPAVDDEKGAWAYYLRNWEPGAPRLVDWPANHAAAVAAVKGA